jgi:hypothetical protein
VCLLRRGSAAARCSDRLSSCPMETALYYTLSTIAQTLAGALAILVAVVLFRFSTLGRVIEDGKAEMRARNIDPTQAWPVLRAGGFDALVDYLETKLNWSNVRNHGPLRTASERAYTAYRDWGRINQRLYATLAATVTDMALCFIALPFTPRIACSAPGTWTVLILAVGLGLTCFGLYVLLIAAMVGRPTD